MDLDVNLIFTLPMDQKLSVLYHGLLIQHIKNIIYSILIEMVQIVMLSHYKCIDLALFACYSYSRNRVGVGGGVNGKYDSSKSRR